MWREWCREWHREWYIACDSGQRLGHRQLFYRGVVKVDTLEIMLRNEKNNTWVGLHSKHEQGSCCGVVDAIGIWFRMVNS